jgi:predicted DNA-binding protein with PD1-like motif
MRYQLISAGEFRTYAVVFDAGDEAVHGLLALARDEDVVGAQVSAIGAFERVTLGFFNLAGKTYDRILIQEQVELLSLAGNLAVDERNGVLLHAHVVVGKADGTAHGGHLLEAVVRPTLEAIVVESSRRLRRRMHPELGVPLLDLSAFPST